MEANGLYRETRQQQQRFKFLIVERNAREMSAVAGHIQYHGDSSTIEIRHPEKVKLWMMDRLPFQPRLQTQTNTNVNLYSRHYFDDDRVYGTQPRQWFTV